MGRPAKPNRERTVPVAVSMPNWEFLKGQLKHGIKMDDVLTILISDWSNAKEQKEAAEFLYNEYYGALSSLKKYRQGLEEALRKETIDEIKAKIVFILGYDPVAH